MDTLFNINGIRSKMDNPPKSNKLNLFFDGASKQITLEQLNDVIQILENHCKEVFDFLYENKEKKEKELIQEVKDDL
jgi:hypothetical protein